MKVNFSKDECRMCLERMEEDLEAGTKDLCDAASARRFSDIQKILQKLVDLDTRIFEAQVYLDNNLIPEDWMLEGYVADA